MSENTYLINNVKNSNGALTVFNKSVYGNLWYVDKLNKLCFTFSPRGGCSISFQCYLDLLGLLKDALEYNSFIHIYRGEVFNTNVETIPINKLSSDGYLFIKFIINPYIRAVSIFRAQNSHNLSFRAYLKQLVNGEINYFNNNDKYHLHKQYIEGEELIINKYIRIDKYETHTIRLNNGDYYAIDVNKYTSIHHGKKTSNTSFCGDIPKNEINKKLPSSYKFFYDDEIKSLVEKYYKDDIEKYNYSFDDFL
jgi:hypothetical protein